jgi:AcrR family transcriptional regulator
VPKPARPSSESPFLSREARNQEREQKREAVLLAAVRMFNARGFHAASLDDVAASLNISKPTIYYYLGNKEEVLLECMTRGLELLQAAAESAARSEGSGLEKLRRFLRRYAEINMDDFGRCVIRTGEEVLSEEGAARFRSLKSQIDRALRRLIEAGIADGSIAPTDVRMAAFTIAGALNWPARWYDQKGSMTPQEISAAIVDILLKGIAPRKG